MKKVKYPYPLAYPDLSGNEKVYLNQALESTWISSKGEFITRFEQKFARYVTAKYAVSTSNGTAALHLALTALGIGPGMEVLVPDLTFVASANAVTYTGAKAVLCDVDKVSWTISPGQILKKISPKTKAIIPVHLYGVPADLELISKIAGQHGLIIIEDAAQAHGAMLKFNNIWKKAGSIGRVGCFSFYGNKIITSGEGGMAVTDDYNLWHKMTLLRDHGQHLSRPYYHPVIGYNYRLTNLQAAIGLAQLERIEKLLNFKKNLCKVYNKYLNNTSGIVLPRTSKETRPVCWLYSILITPPYPLNRDQLMAKLNMKGIETRPFFSPLHLLPPYKSDQKFPGSLYLSQNGLNLPSGYNLTPADVKYICLQILNEIKN